MELPIEIRGLLTPAQLKRYNDLSEDLQQHFLYELSRNRVNPTTLLICTLFGVHYIYLKQIGKFLLYCFTLGGLFIWWIVDITNYRKLADQHNQAIIQKYL